MPYIPTWVDNAILVVLFYVLGNQYKVMDPARRLLNPWFLMLASCLGLMVVAALVNERGSWVSLALFVTTLACAFVTWRLQRMMPPKPVLD